LRHLPPDGASTNAKYFASLLINPQLTTSICRNRGRFSSSSLAFALPFSGAAP